MLVTSGPAWCMWKSWVLLLLVLREVKDWEADGFPSSFIAFHTEHTTPLIRLRALAPRPPRDR